MAIVTMKQVLICGLKSDRTAILDALLRYGNFEISDEPVDDSNTHNPSESITNISKSLEESLTALEILNSLHLGKKDIFASFKGKKPLSQALYNEYAAQANEHLEIVKKIIHFNKTIIEQKAEASRLELLKESLFPWLGLDVPLNFDGTKTTVAFWGTFPKEMSEELILSEYAKASAIHNILSPITIAYINLKGAKCNALLLCQKENQGNTEMLLREIGFASFSYEAETSPVAEYARLTEQLLTSKKLIKDAENRIKQLSKHQPSIEFLCDYYSAELSKCNALSKLENLDQTFFIHGYIPSSDAPSLQKLLTRKYNATLEFTDTKEDSSVPVLLKNNAFASPVEPIVEAYSMPLQKEIDPSGIMSVFYYLLFGIMLGDFGYGIVITAFCAFALLKFKNMETDMQKTLKMFMFCGISTAIWGLAFGSFFGDAVTVIGQTFFHTIISFSPLWFEPIDKPIKMLLFAFAIGIVHLFTGLFIKLYLYIRRGQYKDAVYDVIFWYLLLGGGIAFLFSVDIFTDMAGLSFRLGKTGATIAKWSMLIGAVGIALSNGRSSKNPLKRLAKGLYELYNVTGYLSDVLSYSRLLALGLATGVIAQVFNKIGSMGGGGIFGAILFTVVFLVGHTINLLINLLGAYVHTNRLQFVEFFGKFYEGGGRKYEPFLANTKYYKIKEDI